MAIVEITNDDIEDAVCRMITELTGVARVLPREDCNKYGIDILRSRKNPFILMFHWVTPAMLEINLEFDMNQLSVQGKAYLDNLQAMVMEQILEAEKVRHNDNKIVVDLPIKEPKPTLTAKAVDEVLH